MGLAVEDDLRDLRRANFHLIEKELYHYLARKAELERLRMDIIAGTPEPQPSVQHSPGDSTLSKAVRLQSGVMIEAARRLEAIEWAIQRTKASPEPARWELVKKKYFEGRLTNEGIMAELNISRDTFYRWRNQFIGLIADRLGWQI